MAYMMTSNPYRQSSEKKRIRGQIPDSCLSCEFSILYERLEFIKGASSESCLAF